MKYYLLFIFSFIISLYSCDRCRDYDEANGCFNATFSIEKDGKPLYNMETHPYLCDSTGQYCIDSVQLFNSNFKLLPLFYGDNNGLYRLSYLPIFDETTDKIAVNEKFSKKFFLRLNYLDTDTIEVKYHLERGNLFCNKRFIRDIQAFYNGVEAYFNSDGALGQILFYK
jgi:hypothetical protein